MEEALIQYLVGGARTASEIAERLACSQPTVSRLLRRLAPRVMAMGRARAARYGLRRAIRTLEGDQPVYRIDAEGRAHEIGTLAVLYGGFWYESLEGATSELYPGLPWFLSDMRPQGFVGRAVAASVPELALPPRLNDWSDDHALYWLAQRGEEAIGNLVIGEESLRRLVSATPPTQVTRADYAALAVRALAGEAPGSSPGGEQPKFTAVVERAGQLANVLVKFSEPLATPSGRRWSDLLIAESLAGDAVRKTGVAAARSEAFETGGRMFLEVERFDRSGERGRLGVFSLGTIDDHFVGSRTSWHATAVALVAQRKLAAEDAERIAWLSTFGAFIANSDMHFGNLSLRFDGVWPLTLAPVYDMLPMLYAPQRAEVGTPVFVPKLALARSLDQARAAQIAAVDYWQTVAGDARISADFRTIAADNAVRVRRLSF